jgi:hypothetical protein
VLQAFENGAADAIFDVLKIHSSDDTVMSSATACLGSLASNPKFAIKLIDKGVVEAVTKTLRDRPTSEFTAKMLALVENAASSAPDRFIAMGGLEHVVATLEAVGGADSSVASSMLRAIEKASRGEGAIERMKKTGAIKTMLEAANSPKFEKDPEAVESMLRCIERLARDKSTSDYIRDECGGLEAIAGALDHHSSNDRVAKVGGRALSRLAASNVEELVRQISDPHASDKQKQLVSSLLANLATDEENVDKIINSGGLIGLLSVLSSDNPKSVAAAARAVGRIAETSVQQLDDDGCLKHLRKAYLRNKGESSVLSAVVGTLNKYLFHSAQPEAVIETGIVAEIIEMLKDEPDMLEHTEAALELLEGLAVDGYSLQSLRGNGVIEAVVVSMMITDIQKTSVQLNGCRCLIHLASDQSHLDEIMAQEGIAAHVIDILRQAKGADVPFEVIKTAMYLVTSMCADPKHAAAIQSSGGLKALLPIIAKYNKSSELRESCAEIVECMRAEEEVARLLDELPTLLEQAQRLKTAKITEALYNSVQALQALSVIEENARSIADPARLERLASSILGFAKASGMKGQEESLTGLASLVTSVYQTLASVEDEDAATDALEMMREAKLPEAILTASKLHPKVTTLASVALGMINDLAVLDPDYTSSVGGVETCVSILRSNGTVPQMMEQVAHSLLMISSTPGGAVAVAKNGGTKQIVTTVSAVQGAKGVDKAVEKLLSVLNRVAVTTEGAEILRKQDAVSTVLDAADNLKNSAVAQEVTRTCLDRLMQTADVQKTVDTLTLNLATSKGASLQVATLAPILNRIGQMAASSTTAASVQSSKGDEKIIDLCDTICKEITAAENAPDSESDAKRAQREQRVKEAKDLLPTAIGAISNLVKAGGASTLQAVTIEHVGVALERGIATEECLDVVTVATGSEETCRMVISANEGAVMKGIVALLKDTQNVDAAVLSKAFSTVAGLSRMPGAFAVLASADVERIVPRWLDDKMEDTDPANLESALKLLSALADDPEKLRVMLNESHLTDVMRSLLETRCQDPKNLNPGILGAIADLASQISRCGEGKVLREEGIMRRILKTLTSVPEYMAHPVSVQAVVRMVRECSDGDTEGANYFVEQGVQELVMAAMDLNGTNDAVLAECAKTLRTLGTSVDVSVLTKDVEQSSKVLAEAEKFGPEMVRGVVSAVRKLGNYMMMEGMVTPDNAAQILESVSEAIGLIAESELASPTDVAYGLSCIARLAGLAPVGSIDMHSAVEVVLDVQDMYSSTAEVARSAVDCLGVLSRDEAAVVAMADLGAVGQINKLATKFAGDLELQQEVKATISQLTAKTVQLGGAISVGDQGDDFVVEMLQASVGDKAASMALLDKIAVGASGAEALWSLAERFEAGASVTNDNLATVHLSTVGGQVVESLANELERQMHNGTFRKIPVGEARAKVVATILQDAINARSSLSEDATDVDQAQALEKYRQAMIVLSGASFDKGGADAFSNNLGVDNLVQLLEVDLEAMKPYVPMITNGLAQSVSFGSEAAVKLLANERGMELLCRTLAEMSDDRNTTLAVLATIGNVVKKTGAEKSGISRDVNDYICKVVAHQWSGDPEIKSMVRAIQGMMETKFSSTQQAAVRSTVASAVLAIQDAGAIKVVVDDTGTTSYVDEVGTAVDGTRFLAMKESLALAAEQIKAKSANNMVEVPAESIISMVKTFKTNLDDPEVAKSAATLLSSLSANVSNCEAIAEADGVAAVLSAYAKNPDDPELVESLVLLLARIARNAVFKSVIMSSGGVEMLVRALMNEESTEETVQRALGALADLVHESLPCIEQVMSAGAVKGVEKAMQRFPKSPRLLEFAMTLLSNLTHGSKDNMLVIGQTCGDEISKVIWDFAHDKDLAKMAMRALGNLANVDENVRYVVLEHNAVDNIKRAISQNKDDEELLSIGLEVFGNFASSDVQGDEEESESIRMHMHTDAATDTAVKCMEDNPYSASIQTAGLFAITELLSDPEVRVDCEVESIVNVLISALRNHEWDSELMKHAAELVRELPARGGIDEFVRQDGIQLLMTCVDNHRSNDDVIIAVDKTLAIMCAYQREIPDIHLTITSVDVPGALLTLMEESIERSNLVAACLEAMAAMAVVEQTASTIAEEGLRTVVKAISMHMNQHEVLIHALRLVDLISLNRENINAVANSSGINALFDVCVEHGPDEMDDELPDIKSLVVIKQAVATLSTISSASTDFATLMMEEGLDDLLATFIAKFDKRTDDERAYDERRLAGELDEGENDESEVPDDDPILNALSSEELSPSKLLEALKTTSYTPRIANLLVDVVGDELVRASESLEGRREEAMSLMESDPVRCGKLNASLDKEHNQWIDVEEALDEFITRAEVLEQLTRDSKGALNMMGALDGINKSTALQARAARSALLASRDEVAKDELAVVKNALCVAKLMNVWHKGRCTTYQVLLSHDMDNIAWQDASTGAKRGNISLSAIAKIVDGVDPEHFRVKSVDPKRCFYIQNPTTTMLALEPMNPRTKMLWIDNLMKLFESRGSEVEFSGAPAASS